MVEKGTMVAKGTMVENEMKKAALGDDSFMSFFRNGKDIKTSNPPLPPPVMSKVSLPNIHSPVSYLSSYILSSFFRARTFRLIL
jgi:hypothetical protein